MKIAALDLGSNTFLCLICEVDRSKVTAIYSDEVQIVRLGQGLSESKKFHPDALIRAEKTLSDFQKTIQTEKPDAVLAMATSAARDALNKDELFKICQNLQIPLEIIPGEKEAQITYYGAISGQSTDKNRVIIDIGGGSTEFIFGSGQKLSYGQSFDIGCVRLTEKFIQSQPTPLDQIQNVQKFIQQQIQKLPSSPVDEILAVAGTPTALAAAEIGYFDANKIDGYIITKDKLQMWLNQLSQMTVDEKIKFGIPAGRADVILIGVITLLESLQFFNLTELTVSTRGVRYGVALELYNRHHNSI